MQKRGTRFIGFPVSDKLENYYTNIAAGLERDLKIPALSKELESHITIIPPFILETRQQFDALDTLMRRVTRGRTPFAVEVNGIGTFDNGPHEKILYLVVHTTYELGTYVRKLKKEFRELFEGHIEMKDMSGRTTLHVSLARHLNEEKLEAARTYIGERPLFSNLELLSSITIYRRSRQGGTHHVREQTYPLA